LRSPECSYPRRTVPRKMMTTLIFILIITCKYYVAFLQKVNSTSPSIVLDPRITPYTTNPSTLAYENDTERQCQLYNANKHENPKIVQRDAGEVRDEVPAKKGPKRLLMKAELRLLCHDPHYRGRSFRTSSGTLFKAPLPGARHRRR
jgi:hypothetical protein